MLYENTVQIHIFWALKSPCRKMLISSIVPFQTYKVIEVIENEIPRIIPCAAFII